MNHAHKEVVGISMRVLIVEDNVTIQKVLEEYFRNKKITVQIIDSFSKFETLSSLNYDWALVDLDLEKELIGLQVVEALKDKVPSCVFSGHEELDLIKKAYDLGAIDYLVKPFTKNAMDALCERMSFNLSSKFDKEISSKLFISSPVFLEELKQMENSLLSKRPLLLLGETGVGKTHLAYLIHKTLYKEKDSFIHINCAELNESLLESELFGHAKGSFTGALEDKVGKIELAHGGTLFLDEIASISEKIQQKLLKVLEEGTFSRVGETKERKSDFFLISATCDSLESDVQNSKFRKDLYFRIKGLSLEIPALRGRKQDIEHYIQFKLINSARKILIDEEVMDKLFSYPWPGNMRELNGVLDKFLASLNARITSKELPSEILNYKKQSLELLVDKQLKEYAQEFGLASLVKLIEGQVVKNALLENKGNVRDTIRTLKISSNTFYRIMNFMEDRFEK